MDNCKRCKFFKPTQYSSGLCREHSPFVVLAAWESSWPTVAESDWCGDFVEISPDFSTAI